MRPSQVRDGREGPSLEALEAFDAGVRHLRDGRHLPAQMVLREACFLAPTWASAWSHLGLACASAHEWRGAIAACLVAIELEGEGAGARSYETVGLAATMLGDWPRARWAWRECGWSIDHDGGPIRGDFGIAAARVRRSCGFAEIWCQRSDPVRARVLGVPRPETGRRHGDLILLGTESTEFRRRGGASHPLLDELSLLEASSYQTWVVEVRMPTPRDLDALSDRCAAHDVHVEDWGPSQVDASSESWADVRTVGLAVRQPTALGTLWAWQRSGPDRSAGLPRRSDVSPCPTS